MVETKKCKKCGMPIEKEGDCCSCEESTCCECCECSPDCECGCKQKEE